MGIGRVAGVPALEVRGLSVAYDAPRGGYNQVVRDVDLVLEHGQIVGLAGESGCGKSTVALAATGYLGGGVRILAGRSMLAGVDLLDSDVRSLRHVWGKHIAYVSQQASAALNPALTVAHQLAQPLVRHVGLSGAALRERQIDLLTKVSVFDPEGALARYPFQFSGGQQQRIAIAIALSCQPEVLILDEPTTGLDVTTQARLSALLRSIVEETQVAALYVSHDLALLNEVVDRAVIMYGGEIVEAGSVAPVLRRPRHPYTQALLRAVPSTDRPGVIQGILGRPPSTVAVDACPFAPRCEFVVDECRSHAIPLRTVGEQEVRCIRADEAARSAHTGALLPRADVGAVLLDVDDVSCTYQNAPKPVVRGVTFSVRRGETIGIVGESGSGKSTLLRALSGLHPTIAGTITYDGRPLEPRAVKRARAARHEIQLIFQNPDTSLNPQHTIGDIIQRPLKLFRPDVPRAGRKEAAVELLEAVKLPRSILHRRPPELSGGQKQRVAIARAFAARPALLLCDEVTSALDVSVQATVLELIAQLSVATGTSVIFVSHDLAVVRAIATSTLVMRDGEVCETGETSELFEHPRHPYTQELLAAIPKLPSVA